MENSKKKNPWLDWGLASVNVSWPTASRGSSGAGGASKLAKGKVSSGCCCCSVAECGKFECATAHWLSCSAAIFQVIFNCFSKRQVSSGKVTESKRSSNGFLYLPYSIYSKKHMASSSRMPNIFTSHILSIILIIMNISLALNGIF